MLSNKAQDILRHKVRGKLSTLCASVSRAQIERIADDAVLAVRDDDDMLFDMLVDAATRIALEEADHPERWPHA